MNKKELITAIAEEIGMTKKDVATVVDATFDKITAAMASGDKVQLMGFGTFEVKTVAARDGHNPKTGEAIQIPESKKVSFSASKTLKDSLN